jgi:hypothetical protein
MASYGADNPVVPKSPTPGTTPNVDPNTPISTGNASLDAITAAIVSAHPELQKVRDLIQAKDFASALQALYATDYYKTYVGAKLTNDTLKLTRPGAYNDTINNEWLPQLRQYAISEGFQLTDSQLISIAKSAFDMGLTPGAPGTIALFKGTDPTTGQPYVTSVIGGLGKQAEFNLKQAAADYGVAFDASAAAKQIALGNTTEQEQMNAIRELSKSAFGAWGKQIDAGLTMKQIASPYINIYSNILGIDPAAITLEDKLLKQGLQGSDPANPSAMPLWNFEKAVRQDPRWATSKDAMDSLSNVGATIARQWGLMS